MKTAKLFTHGGIQSISLPEGCYFEGTEVGYKKMGDLLLFFPANEDSAWARFVNTPPVTDDFAEAIYEARRMDAAYPLRDIQL